MSRQETVFTPQERNAMSIVLHGNVYNRHRRSVKPWHPPVHRVREEKSPNEGEG